MLAESQRKLCGSVGTKAASYDYYTHPIHFIFISVYTQYSALLPSQWFNLEYSTMGLPDLHG